MKQRNHIGILVLLAVAFTGCQQIEEEFEEQPVEATWRLTVHASHSSEGAIDTIRTDVSRGIAIGEGESEASTTKLQSIWKDGEIVYVYKDGTQIGRLTATPDASDAHYATLTGSVTSSISVGERITLFTPVSMADWTYTGQNGSLTGNGNSIDSKYNIAKAENVLVTAVSGSNITAETATFVNQQSIYRFSFRFQKNGMGDKTAINVKSITISAANGGLWRNETDGIGPITVTLPTATTDPVFVALRNLNTTDGETYNFQVVASDGVTYLGSKTMTAASKSNGTFVSVKNSTITKRLGLQLSNSTVSTAL